MSACVPEPFLAQSEDASPSWAPSGDSILYVHRSVPGDQRASGIYVLNVATKASRLVLPGFMLSADWNPRGDAFVFAASGGLYVYDDTTASVSQVYSGSAYFPAWSPDDSSIAFDDISDLYTMPAAGGPATLLGRARDPEWSPDSKSLVIEKGLDIGLISRGGAPIRTLTQSTYENHFPAWSHDGSTIAWNPRPHGLMSLSIIDTAGSGRQRRGPAEGEMDWSPQDDRIVFVHTTPSGPRLFLVRRDGTQRQQLTF